MTALDFLPLKRTLTSLRKASSVCKGCELYRHATQTVFGEGPVEAALVLVGEQPGDAEDKAGKPFVGPSGGLLRKALQQAGIEASSAYLTNAVKHFRWRPGGKRRVHQSPGLEHIRACHPWLESELALIKPRVIVCLGAVASRSVMGKSVVIKSARGKILSDQFGRQVVITNHPSAILRVPGKEARERAFHALVQDLKLANEALTHALKKAG